jgi:anti-anti-sigma regulatory factor
MKTTIEQIQANIPVTILSLTGILDASSYRDVIDKATQLYRTGMRALLLDLREVTFLSSSGIVALHSIALLMRGEQLPDTDEGWNTIHAASHFVEEGCEFEKNVKLLYPQPRVLKTLETTGFDHVFKVFTDRDSAIASFQEL